MTPEIPYLETPSVPLALQSQPETGGVFINKVDFYNPVKYADAQFARPESFSEIESQGPNLSSSIASALDKQYSTLRKSPSAIYGDINRPKETSLSQTTRYNDDSLGGYRYNDPTQEYRYGENYGIFDSVKQRTMQFSGNFLSSFLGSFTDIPTIAVGAFNVAKDTLTGGNVVDSLVDNYRFLFDNATTDKLSDLNNWFQEGNETYDTKYSEENPFKSLKIIGDITSSSGFALGGMAGMLASDAAVAWATGGTALAPVLVSQIAKLGAKAIKVLNSGDTAINTLKAAVKGGKSLSEAINLAHSVSKIQKGFFGLNMYTNNLYESSIEAKEAQESTEKKLTKDFVNDNGRNPNVEELTQIKKNSNDAGNYTFAGNMLLLGVTNKLEFGDIIKRMQVGKEAFDMTEKGLVRLGLGEAGLDDIKVLNDAAKETTKATSKFGEYIDKAKDVISKGGVYVRTSAGEAIEEGGQFSISNATEDYYTLKYNKNGNISADQWAKSLGSAIGKTISTKEGWMNMIAGLGGGILVGGLRQVVGLNPKSPEIDRDALINKMTNVKLQDIVSGTGDKLNAHINSVGIADRMNASKDWYSHQSNQHAQVFNWTLSALKGQNNYFSIREEQLKTAKELEGDEFRKTFGVEYNDENKQRIHGYLDSVLEDAQSIKKSYDKINAVYKNPYGYIKDPKPKDAENYFLYETYKDELTYHLSKQRMNEKLMKGTEESILNVNPNLDYDTITNYATKSGLTFFRPKGANFDTDFTNKKSKTEGFNGKYQELLAEQADYQSKITDGIASKEDKKAKKRIDKFVEDAEVILNDWDKSSTKHRKFVKELINFNLSKGGIKDRLLNSDIIELLATGVERAKIKASTERSLKVYEMLGDKNGFEDFKLMEKGALFNALQNQAKDEESTSDDTEKDIEVATSEDKKLIFEAIADKLSNKVALTENEKKIYDASKDEINALVKVEEVEVISNDEFKSFVDKGIKGISQTTLDNIVEKVKNKKTLSLRETAMFSDSDVTSYVNDKLKDTTKSEPVQDPYTGFKEGDLIKSTITKDVFRLEKLDGKHYNLRASDGTLVRWSYSHAHTFFDLGKFNLTGVNTDYTQSDVDSLQNKFDTKKLLEIGVANGGYREATTLDVDGIYKQVKIASTDGKTIVLTRQGILALMAEDKLNPRSAILKDSLKTKKNYKYAGKEKESNDNRTPLQMAGFIGLDTAEELDGNYLVDLNDAYKRIINSPYATANEKEMARYFIQYAPVGTKFKLNKKDSYYSEKDGIHIDFSDDGYLNISSIETILLHESIHYFTTKSLKEDKEFNRIITNVYNHAKSLSVDQERQGEFRGLEEKDNVLEEFIAEGLSNPELMKFLSQNPVRENTRPKTLWKAFIDAIQKVLGIPTENTIIDFLSEQVFTQIDKVNIKKTDTGTTTGMNFNPQIVFQNLQVKKQSTVINDLRNQGLLTEENLLQNATFHLAVADGPVTDGYLPYSNTGLPVPFLRRKIRKEVLELKLGDQVLGTLAPVSTWFFQSNNGEGELKPISELTEKDYASVTVNVGSTYSQFMAIIKAQLALEELLIKNKDTKLLSIKDALNLSVLQGAFDNETDEVKRPFASEFESMSPVGVNGKKELTILSLSMAYDGSSDTWQDRPANLITNLPTDFPSRVFIENIIKKKEQELRRINGRYFVVVSKTGKWESEEDVEFIVAHPVSLDEKAQNEMLASVKDLVNLNAPKTVEFEFDGYISDPYKTKRELRLLWSKGELILSSKYPGDKKSQFSKGISKKELDGLTTFDDFIKILNSKLAERKLQPLTSTDFKLNIQDDADTQIDGIKDRLKTFTSTKVRKTYLNIEASPNYKPANAKTDSLNSLDDDLYGDTAEDVVDIPKDDDLFGDTPEEEVMDDDLFGDTAEDIVEPVVSDAVKAAQTKAMAQKKSSMGGLKKRYVAMPSQALIEEYKKECLS